MSVNKSIKLSEEQINRYIYEGYLCINNLISDTEIQEILDDAIGLIRNKYQCKGKFPDIGPDDSDDEVLKRVLCINNPHFFSPVINKFVGHSKISHVLSKITGAHLPFWDGSVKCMQSMYFIKPPGLQGQSWHQDEAYIPTRDRSLIGVWIALENANAQNGCLWVLPRSHQSGRLYEQKDHNNSAEYDSHEEAIGFDATHEVPVEVKKGTVVFFNGYLLHRSKKNRSNHFRRSLVSHYMTASSLLPWKGGGQDCRRIKLIAGEDPYAYKGVESLESIGFRYFTKKV